MVKLPPGITQAEVVEVVRLIEQFIEHECSIDNQICEAIVARARGPEAQRAFIEANWGKQSELILDYGGSEIEQRFSQAREIGRLYNLKPPSSPAAPSP